VDLLEAWAAWRPEAPPFVLDGDRKIMESARSARSVVTHADWNAALRAPDFAAPGDTRLHLGLLPQPFVGDLRRASVYVLLLNPGLGTGNYFAEYEVPAFRDALLATLHQKFSDGMTPFVFLDPRFAWEGGFWHWHRKLAAVIGRLASIWNVSFAEARTRLASSIASIELFPYHSASFRDPDRWLSRLPSVRLAREFVADHVLPRVRRGEAIVIATRKVALWDLPAGPGVILYARGHARAAHLTPESPGGRAILEHLTRKR